jgi:hypothetical protein
LLQTGVSFVGLVASGVQGVVRVDLTPASLARQRHRRGVRQLLLHMKQVGRVVSPHVSGVSLQSASLVTHALHDGHRQALERPFQRLVPGLGVAMIAISFEQNHAANRLDGDEAGFWMKGFVLADGDVARRHLRTELQSFLAAELDNAVDDVLRDGLLSPVRSSDHTIEPGELQELRDVSNPAPAVSLKDQMDGDHDAVDELDSLGTFEEPSEPRR